MLTWPGIIFGMFLGWMTAAIFASWLHHVEKEEFNRKMNARPDRDEPMADWIKRHPEVWNTPRQP